MHQAGNHDGAEQFAVFAPAFEQLEKLKQEQEIPLGPRGRVLVRRIGRSADSARQCATVVDRRPSCENHLQRPHDQQQHDGQHGQAGHGVLEHLVGPERRVGPFGRLLVANAVAAKQRHVQHQNTTSRRRQHAGVQREEPRQRVMPVIGAADDQLLQRAARPAARAQQVRRHARGPVAL